MSQRVSAGADSRGSTRTVGSDSSALTSRPKIAAPRRGVWLTSGGFGDAPEASSSLSSSACPSFAAMISGDQPWSSLRLTSAPSRSSWRARSTSPDSHATSSGSGGASDARASSNSRRPSPIEASDDHTRVNSSQSLP
eukprot:6415174-Prymnesium_polylepis.1